MSLEPNNLIIEAIPSGVDFSTKNSLTLSESIDSLTDVDLYQFQLNKGQGITLDVTTASGDDPAGFDSFLRIFDSDGNELAKNDDASDLTSEFSLDAYAGFIANSSGNYYVGISSSENQNYEPIQGSDLDLDSENFSGGDYDLTFTLLEVVADEDPDNTLPEAIAIEVDPETQQAAIEGTIEFESDADLYRLEIPEASGVRLNLSALDSEQSLDSYLRLFDESGQEVAANDDNSSENPTVNSAIAFAPEAAGAYFIGISSSGNFNYDALNGDTNLNFEPNRGFSTGDYQLELEIQPIVADQDTNNTLVEATNSGIVSPTLSSNIFSAEIDAELDVDIFKFRVRAEEGINLDVMTEADSELSPYLRLFDSQGNELGFDDTNVSLIPDAPGLYYAAVSTVGNENYSPIRDRTNFDPDLDNPLRTIGSYQIEIAVEAVTIDADPDNTIAEAIASNVSSQRTQELTLTGNINSAADVDIYEVQLDLEDGLTVDLDTANLNSELDSYLRLFDAQGNELAVDNDGSLQNNTDYLLTFVPEVAGTYFVGISSDGNSDYDAVAGSNNFTRSEGFSQGDYTLNLDISTVNTDTDADNTLAEAIAFNPDFTGEMPTISNSIESSADVDLYLVELNLGSTVSFDLNTDDETQLDTFLKIFDAEGNELKSNDDGAAPEELFSLDSYLEFTAPTSGTYYAGVSSYGNFDYDPVDGSNDFTPDTGSTTGDYELILSVVDVVNGIEGTPVADRLEGTAGIDSISGLAGNDTIFGAAEADNLIGGAGNDSLFGSQGDDVLQGGIGADTLFGGNGDDILDGAQGRDRLLGGAGTDIFVIAPDSNITNIVDFEVGTDKIALIEGLSFVDLSFNSSENGTRLVLADKVIGTLVNIEPSQILAADFIAEM